MSAREADVLAALAEHQVIWTTAGRERVSYRRGGPMRVRVVLTWPKLITNTEYTPRVRARLTREEELIRDAEQRGWPRKAERHRCTERRLQGLLADLTDNG